MSANDRPVLVTGAAGFIASHVCDALLGRGERVVALDNFEPFYDPAIKRRNIEEVRSSARAGALALVEGDVCDAALVARLFDEHRFAGVVHLAGRAGVRPSINDPASYARANVEGTACVFNAAARAGGCGRFVLASSSSVYGNNPKVPFSETDDVSEPISPYAATKRAAELVCHAMHYLHGIPTACLRFFTVFGPRQRPDLAISRFLGLIDRQETEALFGDGSASRDFTYIGDIVSGVLAAYDRVPDHGYRIWNLGGSHPVTVRELVSTVSRVVGKPSTLVPGKAMPGDVERTFADLTRSRSELGYEPKTGLEEGIRRQWEWMGKALRH